MVHLVADINKFAKRRKIMIIGGVAERSGGSVYATIITIDAQGKLVGRHRKLKPTWRERLVWADGDSLGLRTHDTKICKIGSLNCWENWLPLARAALHQQDEFIHIGVRPGSITQVDDITRFIAIEGKTWSIAACGLLRAQDNERLSEDIFPLENTFWRASYLGKMAVRISSRRTVRLWRGHWSTKRELWLRTLIPNLL